jgi:hypothetical protein
MDQKCAVSDRMDAKYRAEIPPRISETFGDRPRTVERGAPASMTVTNIGARPAPTPAPVVSAAPAVEWRQTDIGDLAPVRAPAWPPEHTAPAGQIRYVIAELDRRLTLTPARYPRHARRGEPRTGCGIPAIVIGLAACRGFAVNAVGDPVAVCCSSGCRNGLAASGAPGSGGRPPRPPTVSELPGRPLRAAQVSRNWPLASRKVPSCTTKLPATSVFGAAMLMVPLSPSSEAAWITLSGVRMS